MMAMMMEALKILGLHLAVMKALLRCLAQLICWAWQRYLSYMSYWVLQR